MPKSTQYSMTPTGQPPLHIAILPDGGRRWSLANGTTLDQSYSLTIEKLFILSVALLRGNCNHVSILLSTEGNHLHRTVDEVRCINDNIRTLVVRCLKELDSEVSCTVESFIPPDLAVMESIPATVNNTNSRENPRTLSLFTAYSAQREIRLAIDAALQGGRHPSEFNEYLWVSRPVDLVVRTGGYAVMSAFLPLMTGYSRLYFLPELFNDIAIEKYSGIVEEFLCMPRLYGA
jgi:undecaprenyl diphosphate synthase